jgi:CRISPR-associated endonuclease Cas1
VAIFMGFYLHKRSDLLRYLLNYSLGSTGFVSGMNMLNTTIISENADHDAWSERGNYWLRKLNPVPQYKARKRRVIHRPLVLSGHGIRLNVHSGTLLIKCGFTHHPQKPEEYRFFPQDRQLPSRIVILDGDGSITFDALQWLSEQDVPLVQISWRGEVVSVGGANYAANPELVHRQLEIKNSISGFEYSKWLILKKIENCFTTVKHISGNAPEVQLILNQINSQAELIKNNKPQNLSALLGIEGTAAAAYFRYWYTLPLRWKGIGKKPIPEEWMRIGSRIAAHDSNQFARHPINAILNYAYGVLENQVRGQLVSAGIDPTIGYIHSCDYKRHSLVFDLMEPIRPIMDSRILQFAQKWTFSPSDFILNKNGTCRLHPQFARFIVKSVQDLPEIETITAINLKKLLSSDKLKNLIN